MKHVLFVILFSALASYSYGQISISGYLKRTDSTVVKLDTVYARPDTGSAFPLQFDITDTSGFYSMQVPSLPAGFKVVTSAKDCNGIFVTDTQTYNGGNVIWSNLVICVAPTFKITGYVHLGSPAKRPPVGEGRVYLIEKCAGDVLNYIDSTNTDTNGFYSFDPYPTLGSGCSLIMRAAMGSNASEYSRYVPGYHLTNTSYGLRWAVSAEVTQSMGNSGVNLLLPEAINTTGGPAVISGRAVHSATNNVLSGYQMTMTDMNDVTVAYTHTDASGNFSFSNIPFGTYKIFGDVWGKANPDFVIKVSADEFLISDILFVETQTEYHGWRTTAISDNELMKDVVAYPNPVNDHITIANLPANSNTHIRLVSADGRVLYSVNNVKKQQVKVSTESLPKGLYLLEVMCRDKTKRLKVLK